MLGLPIMMPLSRCRMDSILGENISAIYLTFELIMFQVGRGLQCSFGVQ